MAKKSFVIAMKDAVKLDSESNMDFLKQLKGLNDKDRTDYHRILGESGIDCEAPNLAAPGA